MPGQFDRDRSGPVRSHARPYEAAFIFAKDGGYEIERALKGDAPARLLCPRPQFCKSAIGEDRVQFDSKVPTGSGSDAGSFVQKTIVLDRKSGKLTGEMISSRPASSAARGYKIAYDLQCSPAEVPVPKNAE